MPISTPSAPPGSIYRVPCALCLEDEPVGEDSQLRWESFPGSIEEVYALTTYREIGADRMPQPGGVAYRGGNWSTFSLELQFRAGDRQSDPARAGNFKDFTKVDLEKELMEMERKARWCQALAFPLQRNQDANGTRILGKAASRGPVVFSRVREALAEIQRNDPPKVLVVFGSWMVIRGYCTTVSIRWEGPWDPESNRPYGAVVNIQIQPLMVDYPTWQTIRNGAWNQQAGTNDPNSVNPSAAEVREEEQRRLETRLAELFGAAGG